MTPDHTTTHPLDDLAVYALDAQDDGGRALVDTHLVGCAACRTELDQHLTTLSHLTTSEAPPPELWDRIARQTTTDADQTGDGVPFDLRRPAGGGPDLAAPHPAAPDPTAADPAPADPAAAHPTAADPAPAHPTAADPAPADPTAADLAAGPRHVAGRPPSPDGRGKPGRPGPGARHRTVPHTFDRSTWLVAVAAAMVIVVGVAVWSLRPREAPTDVGELATAAADDPDATVVTLASGSGDARARVVTTPRATAYVLLDDLPRLPAGRTYQLWKVDDGSAPVSLGALGDGSEPAAAVSVPPGTTAFALSDEPAAGSVAPTAIVATGRA